MPRSSSTTTSITSPHGLVGAAGVDRQRPGVAIRAEPAEHGVRQPALLADVLEQPRAHRAAEHRIQHVAGVAIVVILRIAARAEADVALLELLVADQDLAARPAARLVGAPAVRAAALPNARSTSSRTCSCSRLPTADDDRFGARVGRRRNSCAQHVRRRALRPSPGVPRIGRPSGWSSQKPCVKSSCTRSSGVSSTILISSSIDLLLALDVVGAEGRIAARCRRGCRRASGRCSSSTLM